MRKFLIVTAIALTATIAFAQTASAGCLTQDQKRRADIYRAYDAFAEEQDGCDRAASSIGKGESPSEFLASLFASAPALSISMNYGGYCHAFAERAYKAMRAISVNYPKLSHRTKSAARICRNISFQVQVKKLGPHDNECSTINLPCAQAIYEEFL